MKNYTLHLPVGVKDCLSEECYIKNKVQDSLKLLFYKYHYQLIETPTFEYIDVFTLGDQNIQNTSLYKFINSQGEVVALRSDMTRSIARVVATQNSTMPYPQRYTYVANSFRYQGRYQGKQHEFTQVGIELVGCDTVAGDVEIIILAVEALKEAGIEDFTLHIGSASFLRAMLEALGASKIEEEAIFMAINQKDAVTLKSILKELDATKEVVDVIVKLMQRSGSHIFLKEVKDQLPPSAAQEALIYLEKLYEALTTFQVENYIVFDFSVLSYASYYTGIIFEGFTTGIGEPIIEGGRYDKLLSEFGKEQPAVGMAIHVNRLVQKLQQNHKESTKQAVTLYVWDKEVSQLAITLAKQYRQEGLIIEYSLTGVLDEALNHAYLHQLGGVMYFRKDGFVEVYDMTKGTKEVVDMSEIEGGRA